MPKVQPQTAKTRKTKPVTAAGFEAIPEDLDELLKINIFGRSGTGKTTLWSTFPKPIGVMLVSGVKKSGELHSIPKAERKHIQKRDITESSQVYDTITMQQEKGTFNTLVLDHSSGLNDLHLKEIMKWEDMPIEKHFNMAKRDDYQEAGAKTKEVLRNLLDLDNCNIVVVAQERSFFDDNEDRSDLDLIPYIASDLTKGTVSWLNYTMNHIVRTFIRQKVRIKTLNNKKIREVVPDEYDFCIKTGPDPVYTTKFRVPRGCQVPKEVVNPTYDKLMSIIRGEYGKKKGAK